MQGSPVFLGHLKGNMSKRTVSQTLLNMPCHNADWMFTFTQNPSVASGA